MRKSVQFNNDLIALIQEHYPRAIKGDIEQNARCAADIAVALGGLVAFAYRLNGEVAGRSALQGIIQAIIKNVAEIDQKAAELIRKELPKLLN